jgi:hypothetical protein
MTTPRDKEALMRPRQPDLVWLRDLLDHLRSSQQQLEWSQDPAAIHYLAEAMLRDLDCCRRVCLQVHRRAELLTAN